MNMLNSLFKNVETKDIQDLLKIDSENRLLYNGHCDVINEIWVNIFYFHVSPAFKPNYKLEGYIWQNVW